MKSFQMNKFLKYLACYIFYPFSFLFHRKKDRMAFGCPRNRFEGNPKYLFIEYASQGRKVCWISADRSTVRQIRGKGLPAEYLFSPKGLRWALTSKWWLVGAYSSDILFCLSGGARVFNLWHGVGLKLCEFNITSGPLADRYVKKTARERFYHPEVFRRPDLMLTASPFQTAMFAPAFRIRSSQCIEQGYPRAQILGWDDNTRSAFIDRYEEPWVKSLIDSLKTFKSVFVYMPTWRDSGASAMDAIDLDMLNGALEQSCSALVIKDHFNNKGEKTMRTGNIFKLSPELDIYPVLPYTDTLITDYSSVLYEYILMEGKKVILYLYDYNEYTHERDFFYPFFENVLGDTAYTMDKLLSLIKSGAHPLDSDRRKVLIDKFWGDHAFKYDFDNYLHIQ